MHQQPKASTTRKHEQPKSINNPKASTTQKHQHPKSINIPKASTTQKHQPPKSINNPKASTTQKHQRPQSINNPKAELCARVWTHLYLEKTSNTIRFHFTLNAALIAKIGSTIASHRPIVSSVIPPLPSTMMWGCSALMVACRYI
jgi:hypothetical protein